MSADEVMVLIVSGAVLLFTLGPWVASCFSVEVVHQRAAPRSLVLGSPFLCAAVLFAILHRWSSPDVRDDATYMAFYMVAGGAWLGLGNKVFGLLNLSVRDDVLERDNPAAAWALLGGHVGVTLCYAGGNIGYGPGWWVVVFCGLLATSFFFVLWFMTASATGLSDAITIDRDVAAGVRAAGLFVAGGVVLGRSVAGDWISAAATVADFGRIGMPVLVLYVVAAITERFLILDASRDRPPVLLAGGIPALAYLAAALLYVNGVGPW